MTAGPFLFFAPLNLPLGFGAVALAAECLEVGVFVVVGAALVVDVVYVEGAVCGAACGALVAVSVEYAAPGCGGDVFRGVVPSHCHLRLFFVPRSGREPAACVSGGQVC